MAEISTTRETCLNKYIYYFSYSNNINKAYDCYNVVESYG